jgi:hypothetical protein
VVNNKSFVFLTLGTLVHLRHFKLGCGFAATILKHEFITETDKITGSKG